MDDMPSGLINHGIHNEESQLRVHVCPLVRRIYVFPTQCGIDALDKGIPKNGYQTGIDYPTAYGKCVPPFAIKKCVALQVNPSVWEYWKFKETESTSEKGEKAAKLIKAMILEGMFPLPIAVGARDELPMSIDIKGTDILVFIKGGIIRLQVKCDYRGGEKELGGTGNLYLQTAECNPLQKH